MKSFLLNNQGNYGKVYCVESNKPIYGHKKCIVKVNRDRDVCLGHEYRVMRSLARNTSLKGYFAEALGLVEEPKRQLLYMQYVQHEHTLDDAVESMTYDEKAAIYQHLVCILQMAQEKCGFTHYDLHFNNILLQRGNGKATYYIKHKKIQVPIIKWRPVIIDFGFSHVDDVNGVGGPLTQTHYYMNPLVSCEYYDIYALRRQFSKEGLVFRDFDPSILKSRLALSLFDYLCHALGYVYPLPIGSDTDTRHSKEKLDADNWHTVSPWKSIRTERENDLFKQLFTRSTDKYAHLIEEYLKIYHHHYNTKKELLRVACSGQLD